MTSLTRRSILALAGAGALAACTSRPPVPGDSGRARIDREVDDALNELYATVPGATELAAQAKGILIIPNIRKIGLIASGAYGEGALMIGPAKVDYYSISAAGIGLTIGATAFNQALFFMTEQALQDFRVSDGWELGVDAAVAFQKDGAAAGVTSTQINRPIIEVVFGQRGLIADASLAGAKYSRIVR
ncbi:lipid-binding SYLF domain-containing protein [Amaricoccus macauensis]|jgi:lipid-binding SYLF domain-containing protein|uniref:Lipid-binding SYLF domain-containing protein n=1 Tax=Amaricoccus macauensis TaxID=57001 RepID=A0A840SFW4_9RHOB|nr:lipid-binding SYLF domain-containing protein [Amaricoccus macauensis]MBB5220757.1 lipid-binding SYLF domain-containing protein [Amaricoccus macauensis]